MQPARHFAYSAIARKSIVDTAKDVLDKANKKTGEFLAGTIETTEKVAPTPENLKTAAEEVNLKTGRILADGIKKAESVTEDVKTTAKDQAESVSTKLLKDKEELKDDASSLAGKLKKDAKDKFSDVKEGAENLGEEAKSKADEAKGKAADLAEDVKGAAQSAKEKKRVAQNAEGYKDLQDRGSKLESEQQRPDDGV